MKSKKMNKVPVGAYVVLLIWTMLCVFPLYWMFTFSLKENAEIFGENAAKLLGIQL